MASARAPTTISHLALQPRFPHDDLGEACSYGLTKLKSPKMEDAVRPSEETSKALFEKGFLAWSRLRNPVSEKPSLLVYCLEQLENAFPDHPAFPRQLLLEYSGGNLFANGVSTWDTKTEAPSSCLLPSFQLPFRIPVSISKPTAVCLSRDPELCVPNLCIKDDNHIMILVLHGRTFCPRGGLS